MQDKKVLIINGHPDPESFNHALVEAYTKGAKSTTAAVDLIHIKDLEFDPNLKYGYRKRTELEPDLLASIDKIKQAEHICWIFPMWWFSYPAIMKGFIDRTFLPGITFETVEGKAFPKRLLKGKTARIIITADTPRWYDRLFMGSPALNQFKKGTLEFCGIKPVKVSYISTIKSSSPSFRQKWLKKVEQLGKELR
ncbi:MAG: NAD(P)H-dependent oxidoreductase [Bacteroidota bacterium]